MNMFLKTENLAIGYKNNEIVSGLNLSLSRGEVTALIGRNGAGKSTLLKTLIGNIKALKGKVVINDIPLNNYSRKELAKLIAVVNTDPHMAGGLKLTELVALGRTPHTGIMGILTDADKAIIEESMKATGIYHKKEAFISELSDGERQKGMIARGLAQQTPIIIMDEPFSYLDVASRLETLALLKKLAQEKEKAILFSTHDVTEALRMADRIWLFVKGLIVEGKGRDLIDKGELDFLFPDSNVKFDREKEEFFYCKKNVT